MEKRFLQVASLIAEQPPLPASAGLSEHLQRLCMAAVGPLSALGVGVNVIAEDSARGLCAASDTRTGELEELQFTLGEGPCEDAFGMRRPVLVPELDDEAAARWPAYTGSAHTLGVRAIFAFPLQIGAARVGVLDVFRASAGMLPDAELKLAFTFAEVATSMVLDQGHSANDGDQLGQDLLGSRAEVFQAQGMLASQLNTTLVDAMARMRAHAFAHDLLLTEIAARIIAGRLRLAQPDHD